MHSPIAQPLQAHKASTQHGFQNSMFLQTTFIRGVESRLALLIFTTFTAQLLVIGQFHSVKSPLSSSFPSLCKLLPVGGGFGYNWLVKELGLDILPYIGLILPHNSNRRIAMFLQTKQLTDPGDDGSSGRCLRSAAAGGDPGLEDLGGGGGRHRLRAAQEHCALW